jgi:hypothetical protein
MDVDRCWQEAKSEQPIPASLTEEHLHMIVSSRVRKELARVGEFVWAAIVYQIIMYSFLAHTLIRQWGDSTVASLCLAGAAMYIPLTVALIRKTALLYGAFHAPSSIGAGIKATVESQYSRLADFFRFKKRLDWIGVPVSCTIIVLVTFTLFVQGGITEHPLAALVMFVLWAGVSVVAIRSENAKRFEVPLQHLEALRNEFTAVPEPTRH